MPFQAICTPMQTRRNDDNFVIWEADLATGGTVVTCRLPERPAAVGDPLVATAVDPPWFGPDGAATDTPRPAAVPPPGTANSGQAGR